VNIDDGQYDVLCSLTQGGQWLTFLDGQLEFAASPAPSLALSLGPNFAQQIVNPMANLCGCGATGLTLSGCPSNFLYNNNCAYVIKDCRFYKINSLAIDMCFLSPIFAGTGATLDSLPMEIPFLQNGDIVSILSNLTKLNTTCTWVNTNCSCKNDFDLCLTVGSAVNCGCNSNCNGLGSTGQGNGALSFLSWLTMYISNNAIQYAECNIGDVPTRDAMIAFVTERDAEAFAPGAGVSGATGSSLITLLSTENQYINVKLNLAEVDRDCDILGCRKCDESKESTESIKETRRDDTRVYESYDSVSSTKKSRKHKKKHRKNKRC